MLRVNTKALTMLMGLKVVLGIEPGWHLSYSMLSGPLGLNYLLFKGKATHGTFLSLFLSFSFSHEEGIFFFMCSYEDHGRQFNIIYLFINFMPS